MKGIDMDDYATGAAEAFIYAGNMVNSKTPGKKHGGYQRDDYIAGCIGGWIERHDTFTVTNPKTGVKRTYTWTATDPPVPA